MTSNTGSLSADTLDHLQHASTATLAAQLFKRGFRNDFLHGLRPLCPTVHMVGVATTLRFVPAREDPATYERLGDPAYPQRRAIEPGDVLDGDGDGVVCIPRHVADTVAADAFEQDRLEAFLLERVKGGAPLPGTYPPNEATRMEYEASRREQGR